VCSKLHRAHHVAGPRLQLALTAPIRGGDAAAALQARRNSIRLDMMLGWRPLRRRRQRKQLTRGKAEVQLLRQLQPAEILQRLRHLRALLRTLQMMQVQPRLQHLRRMIH